MEKIKINEEKRTGESLGKGSYGIGVRDGVETTVVFLRDMSRSAKAKILRKVRSEVRDD